MEAASNGAILGKLHLGIIEISAQEKAEWGNIFAAATQSAGPLCVGLNCVGLNQNIGRCLGPTEGLLKRKTLIQHKSINQSIINDLRCPYPLIVIKDTIRVP
jgi:hypothetical protein